MNGCFIEVRLALTRDDPAKQPVLYDLTLHASSSAFVGEGFMDVLWKPFESEDAEFFTNVTGAEPLTYEWYVMPLWTNQWALASGVTGPELVLTNVDLWDDGTWVSNATGETLWLGPSKLHVWPKPINIPTFGAASRYPATTEVFGQTTNFARVEVWLHNLYHDRPEDLDILLVSPSGTKIMLVSDAGGTNTVMNATLVFHPYWQGYPAPPESSAIPSNQESHYRATNYGDQETQLPGAPTGPYSVDLNDLYDTNPNGVWQLYIFDDQTPQSGVLEGSWSLKLYYQ